MKQRISTFIFSGCIWLLMVAFIGTGVFTAIVIEDKSTPPFIAFFVIHFVTVVVSVPAWIILLLTLGYIRDSGRSLQQKLKSFFRLIGIISLLYALGIAWIIYIFTVFGEGQFLFIYVYLITTAILFFTGCIAIIILWKKTCSYLDTDYDDNYSLSQFLNISTTQKNTTSMEPAHLQQSQPAATNRTMIKGFITGGLILLMMIPTLFITSLIQEREARQKEVVREVSSKWATAQTLSGPFLVVPYSYTYKEADGKIGIAQTNLVLLANDVAVNGNIIPEERPRSIYKVLLYKSAISFKGSFKVKLPADIDSSRIDYANAKLCFTLSDFKGIEEEIYVDLNQQKLLLSPGLPVTDFGKTGLSVPVNIDPVQLATGLAFDMQVKIKGSEQLHFIPMSANSKYNLQSVWPSPSFDGEMLPNERSVTSNGFTSQWSFNQANLPFATVIKENTVAADKKMDFGVSLVQPADQYGKTMRSVKYAILFIGLTFAFFFIIELMQKKPFHPVQYVLVGIALVIFYTLLLSISEYIAFDHAYLIAALATILLISLYAKGHFNSWKTSGIFFILLSLLYGFIFILIRLEDTALLVGSIGLFLVLALVMFASRRINWYGNTVTHNDQTQHHV